MPQLRVAPLYTPPAGETAPVGLFVDGMLVRGVRRIVDNGGDVVMILVGREAFEAAPAEPRTAYPTDGAA